MVVITDMYIVLSSLCIRFGKGGSSGIGKDDWDFVSDVINGPKNKTLMRYHHADTTSPDGPCMETSNNAEHIGKLVEDLRHPMRHGKISIDSHKIKSRLGKCTYDVFFCFDTVLIPTLTQSYHILLSILSKYKCNCWCSV